MAVALGRTPAEEHAQGLSDVAKVGVPGLCCSKPAPAHNMCAGGQSLAGHVGLFFTNRRREDVIPWFAKHHEEEFARSGFVAVETVALEPGESRRTAVGGADRQLTPAVRAAGVPAQHGAPPATAGSADDAQERCTGRVGAA